MKIILKEDVKDLGGIGEVVNVSPGFARNYLIPKNLASFANDKNLKQVDHQKRILERKKAKLLKSAESLAEKLKKVSCTISKQAGENEKLYGSVTTTDIQHFLAEEGFQIDRKQIVLDEPIKAIGVYNVAIKLHKDISTELKVWVVKDNIDEKAKPKEDESGNGQLPPAALG